MDSGRFNLRPNSFHLVPGQAVVSLTEAIARGDNFDAHYYWELANGGVAGAWCSTVIGAGNVPGHTPSSSVSSYTVLRSITTNNWPSTAQIRNAFIGGSDQCEGTSAVPLIASFPQCNVLTGNFLSECDNPAPNTKVPPDGISPACEYEDCGRPVPCNPCRGGPETFAGPSEFLRTTYWATNFENFLKDFMGVNQPDEDEHGCARTVIGKSSFGTVTATANLASLNAESHSNFTRDCSKNYCSDRSLDSPSALSFDRPASASEAWRDLGSHGSNRGVSWNFTSYEMRYTNIEDPGDPEYNNQPEPNCGSSSTGLWDEIIYFQDGLGKTFPECPETSESCKEDSGLFKKEKNQVTGKEELVPVPTVTRDTPFCTYDPCWIGWTGGGQKPPNNSRWYRYYNRDKENEDCPPAQGDIVPVPGWCEPEHRVYDYWCLIANHNRCLNVNLLLDGAEQEPFSQKTIFFHDPAFMSSKVCNAGKGLRSWKIPPCAKNETDFTSVNKYPSKTYCHLNDPPESPFTECQL